ncbi:hypothetical protein K458DRAFT_8162 [Lentithecium fluviatile CBS 122367]|uniref:Secreted protein n=1 Tax=Lentithecium fluviatile CBS 122367 TaxID=1168545 RepID=A0A6G1JP62_9PLEO|nr:hypothetical protein K458DRAFT_8162 [Lentithecium fluviatile CBS 122367]
MQRTQPLLDMFLALFCILHTYAVTVYSAFDCCNPLLLPRSRHSRVLQPLHSSSYSHDIAACPILHMNPIRKVARHDNVVHASPLSWTPMSPLSLLRANWSPALHSPVTWLSTALTGLAEPGSTRLQQVRATIRAGPCHPVRTLLSSLISPAPDLSRSISLFNYISVLY